ncbi:unnamed protein product [Microthlaspi erraticum]|uniref:Aspartic peptidase DDI1-type domain-containing protein n=1 Tax=Microthlaspi erraticum TaxID=1685480 RepID=A0A6D2JS68_9BRAS|nr:unnamed protein product [Microthlaspi erraticum]
MIWPEENYPERESNQARKRRLFPKIIPKTDNSGKFAVPCIIKGNILEQSLCDTGANVNIMSKRIAEKIGVTPPKLDERLHPGTTVHRGTRFILPSIGLTGAPCQCLVGSHIVIWYHTRPRQLTRLSSESSSLHAQPPRCQSGWALTCENALDYTFLNNMWLDTPHVLST